MLNETTPSSGCIQERNCSLVFCKEVDWSALSCWRLESRAAVKSVQTEKWYPQWATHAGHLFALGCYSGDTAVKGGKGWARDPALVDLASHHCWHREALTWYPETDTHLSPFPPPLLPPPHNLSLSCYFLTVSSICLSLPLFPPIPPNFRNFTTFSFCLGFIPPPPLLAKSVCVCLSLCCQPTTTYSFHLLCIPLPPSFSLYFSPPPPPFFLKLLWKGQKCYLVNRSQLETCWLVLMSHLFSFSLKTHVSWG